MDLRQTSATDEARAQRSISLRRRSLVGASAWAVPAIVVAGAAPAFASSLQAFTVTNLGSYRGASATDTTATTNAGAFAFMTFRVSVPVGAPALDTARLTITPASGANGLNFSVNDSSLGIFTKTSPSGATTNNATPFVFTAGASIAAGSFADLKIVFQNNSWAAADTPAALVFSASSTTETVSFTGYSGNAAGFAVTGVYDILNPPHS